MIKKEAVLLFIKNVGMYTCICLIGYVLYNYHNKTSKNIPHTDFSFVYAQF